MSESQQKRNRQLWQMVDRLTADNARLLADDALHRDQLAEKDRHITALREELAVARAVVERLPLVVELEQRHIPWSKRTFGEGRRTLGIIRHIEKELKEIERNPTDVTEWIDVVILALDGAWRAGHPPIQVVAALFHKLEIIRERHYPKPVSEDVPSEHTREAGEAEKARE